MSRGDRETVQLWFTAGGLEGPRLLPDSGGLMDQAAIMIDAWDVCRSTAGKWREEQREAASERRSS